MLIGSKQLSATVTIFFEGEAHQVPRGINLAAALLGHLDAGYTSENAITGEHRAPHCLMGVCFDCLVEIDGRPNQQACLITVDKTMHVNRQTELVELN